MSGKPITPKEVGKAKTRTIPPEVFDAFNAVIAERWDGRQSVVPQDEVLRRIVAKMNHGAPDNFQTSRQHVIDNHWLDVEESYRKAGWVVEYDKPAYNETYPATFTFKKRRTR